MRWNLELRSSAAENACRGFVVLCLNPKFVTTYSTFPTCNCETVPTQMGTARSRMTKVAPVLVAEEPLGTDTVDVRGPLKLRVVQVVTMGKPEHCNSEDSDVSAEDATLAEVDRILEWENINESTSEMPTLGSKSSGLCCAKLLANKDIYIRSHDLQHDVCEKNQDNTMNKSTSNTQNNPLLLCNTSTENPATALCLDRAISSLAFPITYDASEEDLMNTIEKEFG